MSHADESNDPLPVEDAPESKRRPVTVEDLPPAPAATGVLGHALLTIVLALGGGLAGSYLHQRFIEPTIAPQPAAVAAKASASSAQTAPGAVDGAPGPEAEQFDDRLDQLAGRVDELHRDVDAVKNAVSEVSALQVRVSDLAESTHALDPLPRKLGTIESRVSDMGTELTTLRGDLKDLRERSIRVATTTTPAATAPRLLPDERVEAVDADLTPSVRLASSTEVARGAESFGKGQYQEASAYFDELGTRAPDDARVWYYAALCHGFATGDWDRGAAELVEKGIALERAGHPSKAEIDATFRDLTTATGKDWLGAYRQRVDQVAPSAAGHVAGDPLP